MNTIGKVFSLLVTSGNQALLANGNTLDQLAEGQLGVFSNDTNLSVAGSIPRNFYFATKNNGKIKVSAGQHIQNRLILALNYATPSDPQAFVFEVTGYTAECETDYALKLEVRNGDIYQRQGFVQFTDTFAVRTGCCDACLTENCNTGSKFELTKLMIEALTVANKDYIVSVQAIEGPGGAVIPDVDAYEASEGADAPIGFRVTLGSAGKNEGMPINVLYKYNRASWGIPVLVDGFSCSGKVTITQEAKPGEGLGYDLRQREYFEKGWTDSPYRTNVLTGLAKPEYNRYLIQENQNYFLGTVVHNFYSEAGWGEYVNELATFIAVPEADANTITSLKNFFTALGTAVSVPVLDLSTERP